MRKARFTEHQIIAVIKLNESERTVKDIYRKTEAFRGPETVGIPVKSHKAPQYLLYAKAEFSS